MQFEKEKKELLACFRSAVLTLYESTRQARCMILLLIRCSACLCHWLSFRETSHLEGHEKDH